MPPSGRDPNGCAELARAPRLIVAIVIAAASIASGAGAQDYPWCSNFADGAGTNCGFSTEQQCQVTVQGSGGYCAQNNTYRRSAGPHKHRVRP